MALRHFNPRSREGSDVLQMMADAYQSGISIHAPAKGATDIQLGLVARILHFNPRSREGSDRLTISSSPPARYFNPRSREGSDGLTQ